jgi:hypothetical protein
MQQRPRPVRAQTRRDRELLEELVTLGYAEKRPGPNGRMGYWPTPALHSALDHLLPSDSPERSNLPPPGPTTAPASSSRPNNGTGAGEEPPKISLAPVPLSPPPRNFSPSPGRPSFINIDQVSP